MHRRVAVIAECHIVELQQGRHDQAIAAKIAAHNRPHTASAMLRRAKILIRRSDDGTVSAGCGVPGP